MRLFRFVFMLTLGMCVGHLGARWFLMPPLQNKPHPEYTVEDPILTPLVNEYKDLAAKRDIKFTHNVTIGFKKIDHEDVVGICHYGTDFREIDIDNVYWKEMSDGQKKELVFHELTHCYCLRKHDFGQDQFYPESRQSKFIREEHPPFFLMAPGYYPDACPLSIMYTAVLSNRCIDSHWNDYISEMFNRCQPY